MELLIPGLILVALMVYASTRIKRTAAAAWESETIDTEEFTIEKPAGFLHVLNGDPKFIFEAYSREFGVETAANLRAARAELTAKSGTSRRDEVRAIKKTGKLIDETYETVDGREQAALIIDEPGDTLKYRSRYHIAEANGKTYIYLVRSMTAVEEATQNADQIFAGFSLK